MSYDLDKEEEPEGPSEVRPEDWIEDPTLGPDGMPFGWDWDLGGCDYWPSPLPVTSEK